MTLHITVVKFTISYLRVYSCSGLPRVRCTGGGGGSWCLDPHDQLFVLLLPLCLVSLHGHLARLPRQSQVLPHHPVYLDIVDIRWE